MSDERKNASKYVGYEKATFRVKPETMESLREASFHSKSDLSVMINEALEQYLDKVEKAAKKT